MKNFFDWTEAGLGAVWRRVEKSSTTDDTSLSALRVLYGLFILFFQTPSFVWLGNVPQSLFLPPFFSIATLFDGFPDYSLLLIIDLLLCLLNICILFGVKARWAGVTFAILYILGSSFVYSFGKINHSIMFPVFILGLSFTNWGVRYAVIPDRKVSRSGQQRILAVLAVSLCFAMFTAASMKALHWVDLDLDTGGFLAWFYPGYFGLERQHLLAPSVLRFPPHVFEAFDYLAVVFELSPLLALLAGRRWWLLWLLAASVFHLMNTLLLNISFMAHCIVYLSFISLKLPVLDVVQKRWSKVQRVTCLSGLLMLIIFHHLYQFITNGAFKSVVNGLTFVQNWNESSLYLALLLWGACIYFIGRATLRSVDQCG